MKIMKNKKIICSLIAISIVLMFFSSIGNLSGSPDLNLNNQLETSQEEIRYTDVDWEIYIDFINLDFDELVEKYKWASGKGTIFDPYVIKGVRFLNVSLKIDFSSFFLIEECMFVNYTAPYGYHKFAGLSIGSSRHVTIRNNKFINCSIGLSIYGASEDIIVSRNDFLGSHNDPITGMGKAIYIYDVVSVIIEENYIYAYYDGIVVRNARKILIMNNRIETVFGYISDTGVYFYYVDDSSITDNSFFGCTFDGREYNVTSAGNDGLQTSYIGNCNNLTIYGNKYYDLDGNLIGEPIPLTVIDYIVATVVIVVIVVIVVVVFRVRKRLKV